MDNEQNNDNNPINFGPGNVSNEVITFDNNNNGTGAIINPAPITSTVTGAIRESGNNIGSINAGNSNPMAPCSAWEAYNIGVRDTLPPIPLSSNDNNPINFGPGNVSNEVITFENNNNGTGTITFQGSVSVTGSIGSSNNSFSSITAGATAKTSTFGGMIFAQAIPSTISNNVSFPRYQNSDEGLTVNIGDKKVLKQDILNDMQDALSLFTDNDCSVINNEDTSLDLAGETLNPDE